MFSNFVYIPTEIKLKVDSSLASYLRRGFPCQHCRLGCSYFGTVSQDGPQLTLLARLLPCHHVVNFPGPLSLCFSWKLRHLHRYRSGSTSVSSTTVSLEPYNFLAWPPIELILVLLEKELIIYNYYIFVNILYLLILMLIKPILACLKENSVLYNFL